MLPTDLPNANANEPANPASTETPATPAIPQPQANYVTREDLTQVVEGFKEAIAAAIQAGPTVGTRNQPTGPAEMTDDEIMQAINDGKPAAAIKRLRDEIEQRLVNQHIMPMQTQSLTTVLEVVKKAAETDAEMPYYAKFKPEIEKLVNQVPLQQRASIECFRTAYSIVASKKMPDIIKEEVEKAMRAAGAGDGGQLPNGQRANGSAPGVPDVDTVLGPGSMKLIESNGWTPDQYAKKVLGKNNWAEAAAHILKQNEGTAAHA